MVNAGFSPAQNPEVNACRLAPGGIPSSPRRLYRGRRLRRTCSAPEDLEHAPPPSDTIDVAAAFPRADEFSRPCIRCPADLPCSTNEPSRLGLFDFAARGRQTAARAKPHQRGHQPVFFKIEHQRLGFAAGKASSPHGPGRPDGMVSAVAPLRCHGRPCQFSLRFICPDISNLRRPHHRSCRR